MSWTLFETVVASSLIYQNYQLDSIGRSVEGIRDEIAEANRKNDYLAFLRDKLVLINRSLKIALETVQGEPRNAHFMAYGLERHITYHSIQSSSFETIADKEYFHNTVDLVNSIKMETNNLLSPEEREQIEELVHALDYRSNLGNIVRYLKVIPKIEEAERIFRHDKFNKYNSENSGCGFVAAIAILFIIFGCPILFLSYVCIYCFFILEIAFSFAVFICNIILVSILGSFIYFLFLKPKWKSKARKKIIDDAAKISGLRIYYNTSLDPWFKYINREQSILSRKGYDANKPLPDLLNDLQYFQNYIRENKNNVSSLQLMN